MSDEKTVLIVDDNEINLKVIATHIKELNYKVVTVASGAVALRATRKIKFDLIFLDNLMPEMDGVQTREAILADADNLNHVTPMIMLTANVEQGAREHFVELGFQDFVAKPVVPAALIEIIDKYIKR